MSERTWAVTISRARKSSAAGCAVISATFQLTSATVAKAAANPSVRTNRGPRSARAASESEARRLSRNASGAR